MKCKHCGMPITYDDYFSEWQHTSTADPLCTDPFTGKLLSQWAEPDKEDAHGD